ncbi:MAG: sigma-E processing peptidase SpoIIGA [Clostridia bacterium]|nr:sigma-E processing peptidase SpoIIGA [Clostridia bacterium]
MEVYIEYAIIDNLAIDFLLLKLARKSLKLENKNLPIFFAACIGAAIAVVLPLFNLSNGFLYVVKIITGALLALLSGRFRTVREYVLCFHAFLFFTFLFGGATAAVFYFIGKDFNALDFSYNAEISLGAVLAIAFSVFWISERIIVKIYRKREISPFLRKCTIEANGEKIELSGFIDSGNRLFHKRTGAPIILCSPKIAEDMRNKGMLLGSDGEVMIFSTVGGKSAMQIYKLDKIQIYNGQSPNTIYNVMIGFSPKEFSDGGEYDLILNSSMA